MRITIVDDELDYLRNLQRALIQIPDCVVTLVETNGLRLPEIISALVESHPDFVLLDHDLGSLSGNEVAVGSNIARTKLIGTSSSGNQSYCGSQLRSSLDKSWDDLRGSDFLEYFSEVK